MTECQFYFDALNVSSKRVMRTHFVTIDALISPDIKQKNLIFQSQKVSLGGEQT